MKRILYVVNDAPFFLSHRLSLALAAQAAGHEVHVATPDSPMAAVIQKHGLEFHAIPIRRSGRRIWREVQSIQALIALYRRLQPDLVHHVTIKPVLYGGLAARIARVPAVVHAVSGLGHVFIDQGMPAALLRRVVTRLYRISFGHRSLKVIFQNPDDQALMQKLQLIAPSKAVLIRGSGVDMSEFKAESERDGEPVVILAARMLWAKGVGEFVDAARQLREQKVAARFVLVGESDPGNPSAVPVWQLEEWHDSRAVEWWGMCSDMPRILADAHVVCLPSYREGLPKVLIEAAACGRPIVTTDTPGCREVVRHEENGLLVPPRDSAALAAALRRLILSPALRAFLGQRGREIAVAEFGLDRVVEQTLAVYRELLEEEGREAVAASG